jgi:alpha-L-fucosidase 2
VSYQLDGVNYSREYFCSYPKNALAMKFKADKPGKVGFALYMDIIQDKYDINITDQEYNVTGFIDGGDHKFQVKIIASTYGGGLLRVTKLMGLNSPYLGIENADSVVLILNVSTDYKQHWPDYKGTDPEITCKKIIGAAKDAGYEAIKKEHLEDYSKLYSRVQLNLNSDKELDMLPTDERFIRFKEGKQDLGLKNGF